ncbi:hypothetical protein [Chondromyces apiculatus]|uniref:Co-chaperone DjlA N-terminal domain-containing protein n=1 Tax=Chondromyces apiculatus DSM 436 TaxID=1192034 RepID=A0A017T4F5_9BACT|nr:hypothetical protein [Chondromyces apiculatus]EYF04094.1 Hypothetical protein CAP_4777 [Chondromyces apiculatus DSM 436]
MVCTGEVNLDAGALDDAPGALGFRREPQRRFEGEPLHERQQSLGALSGGDEDEGVPSPWRARQTAWQRRRAPGTGEGSSEDRVAADTLSGILGAVLLVSTAPGQSAAPAPQETLESIVIAADGILDRAVVGEVLATWTEAQRREGFEACLARAGTMLRGLDARYEAFQLAAGVALVDGDLSRGEATALGTLARELGLSSGEAEQLFDGVSEWMG